MEFINQEISEACIEVGEIAEENKLNFGVDADVNVFQPTSNQIPVINQPARDGDANFRGSALVASWSNITNATHFSFSLQNLTTGQMVVSNTIAQNRTTAVIAAANSLVAGHDYSIVVAAHFSGSAMSWSQRRIRVLEVELLPTADIHRLLPRHSTQRLVDLVTMQEFNISFQTSPNWHVDWSPATRNDTGVIQNILAPNVPINDNRWNNPDGSSTLWSWGQRQGVLRLSGGRLVAVGFHLYPHGSSMVTPVWPMRNDSDTPPWNRTPPLARWPLGGHMCMYFGDSGPTGDALNSAARQAQTSGNSRITAGLLR